MSGFRWSGLFLLACCAVMLGSCVNVTTDVLRNDLSGLEQLRLNELQFFGSHNSYKKRMDDAAAAQLQAVNPQVAASLEYWHEPLDAQLELGLRVFELDVFFDPQQRLFGRDGSFPVLHVQNLDDNSHCEVLRECLEQLQRWREVHPDHEPLLISFNAKTDVIDQPGFLTPLAFDRGAWQSLDAILAETFGAALIRPAQVLGPEGPQWPTLAQARGKILLLLDEGAGKNEAYLAAVARPALFVNLPGDDPRAAIRVLNDPIQQALEIRAAARLGQLVRTRADADTREARTGDVARRDAAFASGAHFVSTDYYLPAQHFGTDYVVTMPDGGAVRCNPAQVRHCPH